jgi:hypothetical protein
MKINIRIGAVSVAAIVLLYFVPTTQGQNNPLGQIQFCGLCGDPLIPGATCQPEGDPLFICFVNTYACTPAAAVDETACNKCGGPTAGSPINLTNGNASKFRSAWREGFD